MPPAPPLLPIHPLSQDEIDAVGAYVSLVQKLREPYPVLLPCEPSPVPEPSSPLARDLFLTAIKDPHGLAPRTKIHLHLTSLWWDYKAPFPVSPAVAKELDRAALTLSRPTRPPISMLLAHIPIVATRTMEAIVAATAYWQQLLDRTAISRRAGFIPSSMADMAIRLAPVQLLPTQAEDRQLDQDNLTTVAYSILASISPLDAPCTTPTQVALIERSISTLCSNRLVLSARVASNGLGINPVALAWGQEAYTAMPGSIYHQLQSADPTLSPGDIFLRAQQLARQLGYTDMDYIFLNCGISSTGRQRSPSRAGIL